jgi:hypothetical protein
MFLGPGLRPGGCSGESTLQRLVKLMQAQSPGLAQPLYFRSYRLLRVWAKLTSKRFSPGRGSFQKLNFTAPARGTSQGKNIRAAGHSERSEVPQDFSA